MQDVYCFHASAECIMGNICLCELFFDASARNNCVSAERSASESGLADLLRMSIFQLAAQSYLGSTVIVLVALLAIVTLTVWSVSRARSIASTL